MAVRPNWREIDVIDLTDAEVAQMTQEEERWCLDLLVERHRLRNPDPIQADAITEPDASIIEELLDFDRPGIAVLAGGDRISIYPGEHESEECFAGEKLPPLTAREIASNSYVSCLWLRSHVVRIEPTSTQGTAP